MWLEIYHKDERNDMTPWNILPEPGADLQIRLIVWETEDIECSGIFPYISFNPSTDFVDKTILNDKGYIKTNPDMSTSIDGLFAAGDCIEKDLRQIVTAASDGAIAATSIIRYLKNKA
mgnify:CR=1 FL=1